GITISTAKAQTTMSFMPIERDLILNWEVAGETEASLIWVLHSANFVLQSNSPKKFTPAKALAPLPQSARAVPSLPLPHPGPPAQAWTDILDTFCVPPE